MVKRYLALCTVISLLLFGGCSTDLFPASQQEAPSATDPDKYQASFQDAWQYSTLSDQEKEYYGYLYTAVKDAAQQESTISFMDEDGAQLTLPGVRVTLPNATLSKDRITALYEAFFRDNPQFFYLNRTYHLEGRHSGDDTAVTYDTLLLEFSLPLEERRSATQQLETITDSLLASCPTDKDDYNKELYLHDRLAEICTYDQEAANSVSDAYHTAYTAYGALVEGKAVCEGYAKAMQLLLARVDIPATVVTGSSLKNGEPHMWNLVNINGNTYYLDPTWNDSGSYLQHTYFNLTTEMLASSHQTNPNQPVVTDCTATEDNYFIRNNAYIDTYERLVIAQSIAEQLAAGETVIQLRFAPGKFSNGQLFLKNRTLTCQMVNPYVADKGLSLWEYQLWADDEQQVLSLVKN